jgi:hypothetical protein
MIPATGLEACQPKSSGLEGAVVPFSKLSTRGVKPYPRN